MSLAQGIVIGSTGMAGQAFTTQLLEQGINFLTVSRAQSDHDLDLSDVQSVLALLRQIRPKWIINCAAVTSFTLIDSDPKSSWAVNAELPYILSMYCDESADCRLLHMSTDHFFSGSGPTLHSESDKVLLQNCYARQKFAAEQFVLLSPKSLVLRTSILGFRGTRGATLLEWIFSNIVAKEAVDLFTDAWTTSIFVMDFVRLATDMFFEKGASGLYNLAGSEAYSKADLYVRIAERLNGDISRCNMCSLENVDPKRARSLALDSSRAAAKLSVSLPTFEETVTSSVAEFRRRKIEL